MNFLHYFIFSISRIVRCIATYYYKNSLAGAGDRVRLGWGFKANYPQRVYLGSDVEINNYCWISLLPVNSQSGDADQICDPKVHIGSRTYIGRFATIACMNEVSIGEDVLISDRVFIGDCYHGFDRPDLPIKGQYMFSPGAVTIGDGAWIGIGVSILPNVHIGKNAVIGANSVVRCDVPDYHIAAGVPAKIIRDTRVYAGDSSEKNS
jgi:acetyltransferase-like isoleucine patch superfamily enzyme